jgi:ketosteroid isomerase-like protein
MSLRVSLLSVAFLLSSLSPSGPRAFSQVAPSDRPPDQLTTLTRQQLDVIKVLLTQEKAWNRGDIEAFAQGYKDSPETLFIGRQVNRGYAQMLADYKFNYPTREAMGNLSYTELEAHPLDERFAVVLGKYHLERGKKAGGNADGTFSLVMEKTDQGWKVVVDHTT